MRNDTAKTTFNATETAINIKNPRPLSEKKKQYGMHIINKYRILMCKYNTPTGSRKHNYIQQITSKRHRCVSRQK